MYCIQSACFALCALVFLMCCKSAAQVQLWTTTWGSPELHDYAWDVKADAEGNVYVIGSAYGHSYYSFLLKYYSNGTFAWATVLSGGGRGLALDSEGNIYVAGDTCDYISGCNPLFAKYSGDGTKLLTGVAVGPFEYYYNEGRAISVDNFNNIYVAGTSSGVINNQWVCAAILIKFNPDGSEAWRDSQRIGFVAAAFGVTVDDVGAVYVTGEVFSDSKEYGEMIVIKYFANGTKAWERFEGGSASMTGNSIASDNRGSIYVTGSVNATNAGEYDGQPYAGGYGDAFLIKYSSDGTKLWTRLFGSSEYDGGGAVTVAADGNVYVTGTSEYFYDQETQCGYIKAFISKFDEHGNRLWTSLIDSQYLSVVGMGVSVDNRGNIYVAGLTGYACLLEDGDVQLTKYYDEAYRSNSVKLFEMPRCTAMDD